MIVAAVCDLRAFQHEADLPARTKWRTRLQVRCEGRKADICAEQIRTISKARLGTRIATLTKTESAALRELFADMYGAQ